MSLWKKECGLSLSGVNAKSQLGGGTLLYAIEET